MRSAPEGKSLVVRCGGKAGGRQNSSLASSCTHASFDEADRQTNLLDIEYATVGRLNAMALLLTGTVFIFCSSCLAASTGSSSSEEPLELSPSCEIIKSFKKCWTSHHDLPSCGNENSLTVGCAERLGRSMAKCEQDQILDYAGLLIRSFQASDKVLCENRSLYQVFERDGYCWHEARNCAKDIIFSTTYSAKCKNYSSASAAHQDCLEWVTSRCNKQVKMYTDAMFQSSPCSDVALAQHTSLLVLLALPTALFVLLAIICLLTRVGV